MSHLAQIKQRMRAIEKTQKITRAMRLIAMSLYSKLERKKEKLRQYREHVAQITALMRANIEDLPAIFAPEDLSNSRPLIILCTSTKALCGGMNGAIVRYFDKTFTLESNQKASFIAVGSRAITYLKERKAGEIIHTADDAAIATIPEIARTITSIICDAEEPYTSVRVYYTHLQSFFMQSPTKEKIIPLDLEPTPDEDTGVNITLPEGHARYLWEQEPAQISAHIIRHYLYTSIVSVLFDSLISENAARFIAMDQSTNNAEKYLENLSLDYNKSRQSLITREISELASNME